MPNVSDDLPGGAAARLRKALQRLASGDPDKAPTVTALCDLAGVSRNALYRYHVDVLDELHRLQRRRYHPPVRSNRTLSRLRDENNELRSHIGKLATLVDHYFSAWQEANALLQRRELDLAELRRDIKTKVVALR